MTRVPPDPASLSRDRDVLETMISFSGGTASPTQTFDLALFKQLNAEYADKPVVPAPRPMSTRYTTDIGRRRAKTIDTKIGLEGRRILELGCGDSSFSRVLAREHGCSVLGVDVSYYDSWDEPADGDLACIIHDVGRGDNAALGQFDRIVSFAVFEHVVHPTSTLTAAFDLLKPGGKAFIHANLYRGAKASHRYREVFFPWPHLLFEKTVWHEFYVELTGEAAQAAWVNKLTYDQYLAMAGRIGFRVLEHFPSKPYFDEPFYQRFEYELAAYPKFDLAHDFIHMVLEKPAASGIGGEPLRRSALLDLPPKKAREPIEGHAAAFWNKVRVEAPGWAAYRERWTASRVRKTTAIEDGLPWMTFPAIDFLDRVLAPHHRVFEWGSGGSTLFLSDRAARVVSIEHDHAWHEQVGGALLTRTNVEPRLIEPDADRPGDWRFQSGVQAWYERDFERYVRAIESEPDSSFDLVIVDGRARMGCLAYAAAKVAPGGWLLLDNANYDRYQERLAELRSAAFSSWEEIDLAGPGPYSATPCWQTLAWQRPEPLAVPPSKAEILAARAAFASIKSTDYIQLTPEEFIWSDRDDWSDEELIGATSGFPYQIRGTTYQLGKLISRPTGASRTDTLWVHSWNGLEPFLILADREHIELDLRLEALRLMLKYVFEWNGKKAVSADREMKAEHEDRREEDLIDADTAISSRFYCLSHLLASSSRYRQISEATFGRLLGMFAREAALLKRESHFSRWSNHGLMQAANQLAGLRRWRALPEAIRERFQIDELAVQGQARVAEMMDVQFGSDAIHLEHSPAYHMLAAAVLKSLSDSGMMPDNDQTQRVDDIVRHAGWMRDLGGRVAALGDSDDGNWLKEHASGRSDSDSAHARVFPQGGYWFVRGPATYLAQAAAFHSRVHKHADSGTFIWQDRGHPILVDAGRYGYAGRTEAQSHLFRDGFWYSDPRRVYVESTRAHNALELDGRNHPRFRSRPYGSGIIAADHKDGLFACESRIRNLPGATHFRLLVLSPGNWLLCLDDVRMRDGKAHVSRQNFHLHPGWRLETTSGRGAEWVGPEGSSLYLTSIFQPAEIVAAGRGLGNPEVDPASDLFGWWSPAPMEFEPCESIGVACEGSHMTMASLFSFQSLSIDEAFTSFNTTRRRLRFRWKATGALTSFQIERDPKGGTLRLL